MDYETARRVKSRSVKELTFRNIEQGEGILNFALEGFGLGSARRAISSKLNASVTGLIEKVDPLNLVSSLFGPVLTSSIGRLTGRSQKTREYFRKKAQQRQREKKYYTKVAPGRATKLRMGDSTADILAKMLNLMQKDHDENLKRFELESIHNRARSDLDEKMHKELLNIISNSMGDVSKPKKEKGKSFFEKLKDELVNVFDDLKKGFEKFSKVILDIVEDVFIVFKDIFKGILTVFEFLSKIGLNLIQMVFSGVMETFGKFFPGILALSKVLNKLKSAFISKVISFEQEIASIWKWIGVLIRRISIGNKSTVGKVLNLAVNLGMSALVADIAKSKTDDEKREKVLEYAQEHKEEIEKDPEKFDVIQDLYDVASSFGLDEVLKLSSMVAEKYFPGTKGMGNFYAENLNKPKSFKDFATLGFLDKLGVKLQSVTTDDFDNILDYGKKAYEYMKENNLTPEMAKKDPKWRQLVMSYRNEVLIPYLKTAGIEYKGEYPEDFSSRFVLGDKPLFTVSSAIESHDRIIEEKEKNQKDKEKIEKLRNDFEKSLGLENIDPKKIEQDILSMSHKLSDMASGKLEMLPGMLPDFSDITEKLRGTVDSVFSKHEGATFINKVTNNLGTEPEMKNITGDGIGLVRTTDTSLRQCQSNYAIAC